MRVVPVHPRPEVVHGVLRRLSAVDLVRGRARHQLLAHGLGGVNLEATGGHRRRREVHAVVLARVCALDLGVGVVDVGADVPRHVLCGGAVVDELVHRGGERADGVAAVARGRRVQGGGGVARGGQHQFCARKVALVPGQGEYLWSEFLAPRHESRILGHSSNPVCGFSMMEPVRLCAVLPMENWLGSSLNQLQGWTNVREFYSRALEQGPLLVVLQKLTVLSKKLCRVAKMRFEMFCFQTK